MSTQLDTSAGLVAYLNERFGTAPRAPSPGGQRSEWDLDVLADLSALVRIEPARADRNYGELWIRGALHAYVANQATALGLAAMALRIDAATMNRVTQGWI